MTHPLEHPERLLMLADMLDNLQLPSNAEFNMGGFGDHVGLHEPEEQNYCGTSACALGWAALNPEFNKLGLKMEWYRTVYSDLKETQRFIGSVVYKGDSDFDAAAEFFGIDDESANYLFDPWEYDYDVNEIAREVVSARIREFVETKKFWYE